ncbi:MAG: contractile injection system protein, VgrG/Pvc8 family [Pseudomonadota bacterium]|nr:contractile injection system protein, VgrG/Pvc8 family [Pseudomonadota bacterium]
MSLFKLTIEGIDRTTTVQNRLIDLSLTDKRGLEADELSLTLSDHDAALPLPTKGNTIQLWLAAPDSQLVNMGSYVIDEAEHSGSPDQMTIKAKSADMKGTLKVKRSESHHRTSMGDLARKYADRHQLQLSISDEVAAIPISHLDQTRESDMNVLSRLAREHDLVATVKQGRLTVIKAAQGKSASGRALPSITLTRASGDQHRYSRADRNTDYDGATASYHDPKTGKTETIHVDQQGKTQTSIHKPLLLSKPAASAEQAKTRATAKAQQVKRQVATFELTLATGRPDIKPETPIRVQGFRPYIDQHRWTTEEVTHRLSGSGYQTVIKLESA